MADAFGVHAEEDPAAEFLAQQQHEIAGLEDDENGFGFQFAARDQQEPQPAHSSPNSLQDEFGGATMNGDLFQESNNGADGYAAIAQADVQRQEPESLRKWREEQKTRLEQLDSASKAAEAEWKEKAKKELEDWHAHQQEQMEKNKVNNRASEDAFVNECNDDTPGTEWERVARLCDFNPKTSRQTKDVSRMRSVLISLKQTPLAR
ncbi:clathrin light chain B isoform X2 [Neoarius graeffei]|uniref:clathrin light chain B isoform X2 n=1 Tax=Neoarius graeffei TaxID=443677 RepID=UPI00298BF6B8|nr:clathrin light chain B isoform X2 [Neoarius graeffei]